MGSCASAHRESSSSMSAMKLRLSFRSKSDQVVSPASPFKDNTKGVNGDFPIKSQWSASSPPLSGASFGNLGSKDETFFDSQPWLESDCDDDFMSVNGEFTPSRGNTPVHHIFSAPSPQVNKPNLVNKPGTLSTPETPSPTEKKKRLVELFRESGQDGHHDDQYNMSSRATTPYVSNTNSVCSSERTANGEPLVKEEKQTKSGQCCIPSLVSCKSFGDRKKKTTTTVVAAVNGKP